MKITKVETLSCDAGWRPWLFVKISTDKGIIGYSECSESNGSPLAVAGAVKTLVNLVTGKDPRQVEKLYWEMYRAMRQSPGGTIQKAIAGIENALLDIKAKDLGIPVYELFGGPIRKELQAYWSHCGTTRVRAAKMTGVKPLKTLDDISSLGKEIIQRKFPAIKTNILLFGHGPESSVYMPGFGKGGYGPELNVNESIIKSLQTYIGTLRDAVGKSVEIILDLNFNFKTEGYIRIARSLEQFNLMWLEIDSYDPEALLQIKQAIRIPICSGENLYTTRGYRPYFEKHVMDVASVDVIWNGFTQSKKIADMAETYEMNVTPHNHYSHLATLISAHLCATIPNFRILETDIDDVPWKDELITKVPEIKNGKLILPNSPGWGTDLNEEVIRRHPWPKK